MNKFKWLCIESYPSMNSPAWLEHEWMEHSYDTVHDLLLSSLIIIHLIIYKNFVDIYRSCTERLIIIYIYISLLEKSKLLIVAVITTFLLVQYWVKNYIVPEGSSSIKNQNNISHIFNDVPRPVSTFDKNK